MSSFFIDLVALIAVLLVGYFIYTYMINREKKEEESKEVKGSKGEYKTLLFFNKYRIFSMKIGAMGSKNKDAFNSILSDIQECFNSSAYGKEISIDDYSSMPIEKFNELLGLFGDMKFNVKSDEEIQTLNDFFLEYLSDIERLESTSDVSRLITAHRFKLEFRTPDGVQYALLEVVLTKDPNITKDLIDSIKVVDIGSLFEGFECEVTYKTGKREKSVKLEEEIIAQLLHGSGDNLVGSSEADPEFYLDQNGYRLNDKLFFSKLKDLMKKSRKVPVKELCKSIGNPVVLRNTAKLLLIYRGRMFVESHLEKEGVKFYFYFPVESYLDVKYK